MKTFTYLIKYHSYVFYRGSGEQYKRKKTRKGRNIQAKARSTRRSGVQRPVQPSFLQLNSPHTQTIEKSISLFPQATQKFVAFNSSHPPKSTYYRKQGGKKEDGENGLSYQKNEGGNKKNTSRHSLFLKLSKVANISIQRIRALPPIQSHTLTSPPPRHTRGYE